jgi:hypothetical protein
MIGKSGMAKSGKKVRVGKRWKGYRWEKGEELRVGEMEKD